MDAGTGLFLVSGNCGAHQKVLQIVAYYVRDDEAAMKDWTERHGLNLKDWGCCIVYNEQREALLAALKAD